MKTAYDPITARDGHNCFFSHGMSRRFLVCPFRFVLIGISVLLWIGRGLLIE
jgi:hypothetical protein